MLKMNLKEEREFLNGALRDGSRDEEWQAPCCVDVLSEIDVSAPGLTALIQEAKELIAETEDLIK